MSASDDDLFFFSAAVSFGVPFRRLASSEAYLAARCIDTHACVASLSLCVFAPLNRQSSLSSPLGHAQRRPRHRIPNRRIELSGTVSVGGFDGRGESISTETGESQQ